MKGVLSMKRNSLIIVILCVSIVFLSGCGGSEPEKARAWVQENMQATINTANETYEKARAWVQENIVQLNQPGSQ